MKTETGPMYNQVELLDSLPLDPTREHGMTQALPSRQDLLAVKSMDTAASSRTVGGYEVLLSNYRWLLELVEDHIRLCHNDGDGKVKYHDINSLLAGIDGALELYRNQAAEYAKKLTAQRAERG